MYPRQYGKHPGGRPPIPMTKRTIRPGLTAAMAAGRALLAAGWRYDSTTPMADGFTGRSMLHPSGREIHATTSRDGDSTTLTMTDLTLEQTAGAITGAGLTAPAEEPTEVEHRYAEGWKGGPGECGASCACGLTYDGFDTLAEPSELLDRHIAEESSPTAIAPVTGERKKLLRRGLHTDPATLAAALRRAADALDTITGTELSPITVGVNLQAVSYHGTAEDRIAAVDALGMALVGCPGETDDDENDEHRAHRLPYDRRTFGDIDVAVYTALKDYHLGGAS